MTKTLISVNTASDTFGSAVSKINLIYTALANEVVTVNSSSNVYATSTGNGTIVGTFGANTIFATILQGGNVTSASLLTISTNTIANGAFFNISNTLFVGNSTVNTTINSSSLVIGNFSLTANTLSLGNNIFVGNSTVNTALSSNALVIGTNVQLTTSSLVVGNSTINSTGYTVGSNVSVNTVGYSVGNSTVNAVVNSTSISVSNSTTSLVITSNNITGSPFISTNNRSAVQINGANIGTRGFINFIAAGAATVTAVDDASNNSIDVTVSLSGNGIVAGTNTQVQYNDQGGIAGSQYFTFTKTTGTVTANSLVGVVSITSNGTIVANGSITGNTLVSISSVTGNTIISTTTIQAGGNISTSNGSLTVSGSMNGNAASVTNGITANTYSGNLSSIGTYNFNNSANSKITFVKNNYNANGTTVIDSFYLTDNRGGEYLLTIKDNNSNTYQISKVLVMHDGVNPYFTEYGVITSNTTLGDISVSANSIQCSLNINLYSTNTTVKAVRTLIEV